MQVKGPARGRTMLNSELNATSKSHSERDSLMKTAEVMTTPVISVGTDATLLQAAELMLKHRISGLPVIDGEGVVGVVSEADFLKPAGNGTERPHSLLIEFLLSSGRGALEYVHVPSTKVRDVMTEAFIFVRPDTPLDQVMKLMDAHAVKRLPVLDQGRLVGIVSRANLLRAVADILTAGAVADAVTAAGR